MSNKSESRTKKVQVLTTAKQSAIGLPACSFVIGFLSYSVVAVPKARLCGRFQSDIPAMSCRLIKGLILTSSAETTN